MALRRKKERKRGERNREEFILNPMYRKKSEEKYIKSSQIKEKAGWSCFYKEKIKKNFLFLFRAKLEKKRRKYIEIN